MGFGGPHAAYFATRAENTRHMPGRLIGVSEDSHGHMALRMALQTREQHIRRERATSNICTAQVLLAVMSSMYAVYHGPRGLRGIALRVHRLATGLQQRLKKLGFNVRHAHFFDTLLVDIPDTATKHRILSAAHDLEINLRRDIPGAIGVALDETTRPADLEAVLTAFGDSDPQGELGQSQIPSALARRSAFLTHPVFQTHHSETEMQRYIRELESKDLSLTPSMIPLGSCTMKLNAASEMMPVTWPFARLHPFRPGRAGAGLSEPLRSASRRWLARSPASSAVSLQPNSGRQGNTPASWSSGGTT